MAFPVSINEIVDFLGLERKPKQRAGSSYDVRCPFCDDSGYHLNVNTAKNVYSCVRCMGSEKGAGALDLYARVRHGCRAVPGSNTKELYKALLKDLKMETPSYPPKGKRTEKNPEPAEIRPAPDADLSRAYEAMLSLRYLSLSEKHRENLLGRGLRSETIIRNQYASVRPFSSLCEMLETEKPDISPAELKKYSLWEEEVRVGRKIASDLLSMGIRVDHVPGFYRLGGKWCVKLSPGILIPTRNSLGQIVGIQTRMDVKTKKASGT